MQHKQRDLSELPVAIVAELAGLDKSGVNKKLKKKEIEGVVYHSYRRREAIIHAAEAYNFLKSYARFTALCSERAALRSEKSAQGVLALKAMMIENGIRYADQEESF